MEEKTFEIEKQETDDNLQEKEKITKKWCVESKKVWHIAGPAILNAVSLFSLEFVTAAFVGRLGDVELAAVSEVHNVIAGFVYGIMLGMASALATLSGQAVGAGQFNMLGIYLQRSWIITGVTSLLLTPIFIFTSPILRLLRQDKDISHLAGKYALWIIPQMFAYALNFPVLKFLQSQSKVWFMAIISMGGLAFHVLLNWILVVKAGQGLFGAAIAGNISWWLLDIAQVIYITSGYFPEAWSGFSCLAFKSLTKFLKLSLASAIMVCLELWYFTAVILMVGGLKNATTSVDAISICLSLQLWTLMVAFGFTSSTSVRVSNELGAGNPKAAKFSVSVNVLTSAVIGLVFSAIILATRNEFPRLFTKEQHVIKETSKLGYILAAIIFLNGIQPVLLGVAVGAGWQLQVALINIGCYYGFGLPLAALLGYKFKFGVEGILSAMLAGSLLQTLFQIVIIARTSWNKQALQAEERVRTFGNSLSTSVFSKGPALYAFKGLAGRFAPIGVHISLLLIMAGGTLSATGSFRGSVTVPQGLNFVTGDVLAPSGCLSMPSDAFSPEVHVNRFYMEYYDSGEVSQFYTDHSLVDLNGKELMRKTIKVNDPLRYDGITRYQTDWSISALQVMKDDEGPFNLAVAPLQMNGGDKKLFGTFLPVAEDNSPNVKGISMLARDLQSVILYDKQGKFAGVRRPNSKLPIEIDGTKIVIVDAIGSSGLDLKTDPGVPVVYAGFGALMLTTCISYLSHTQLWALQDGTSVVVGGKTNRAKGEFPDTMNRLLDQVPELVESSSTKEPDTLSSVQDLELEQRALDV